MTSITNIPPEIGAPVQNIEVMNLCFKKVEQILLAINENLQFMCTAIHCKTVAHTTICFFSLDINDRRVVNRLIKKTTPIQQGAAWQIASADLVLMQQINFLL